MHKKRQNTKIYLVLLPVVVLIFSICAFLFVINYLHEDNIQEDAANDAVVVTVEPEEPKDNPTKSYISETNYKGNLSDYPELYEIPFKKSDAYICNKDFYAGHSEVFPEYRDKAKQFMESLFNVNYREIAKNKAGYDAGIMINCDYDAYKTLNWNTDEEQTESFFKYIEDLTDYFERNMVEMEAKFYTDDSLIYSDFYTFVRGELVFTIYSSEDEESEYKVGEEYKVPMEVAMHRSSDDSNIRTICSFGKASDPTFFLNP